MSQRADEIRKRIAKRKKERLQYSKDTPRRDRDQSYYYVRDEEKHGVARFDSYEMGGETGAHPLFPKEWFMFKVLASACLLLIVAIMYKDGTARFENVREFVTKTMENEFQFAAVSTWYEEQFGKPLALLPTSLENEKSSQASSEEYAVPANGRILENFETNGQGVMIETGTNSTVEAINEGSVISIGQKEDIEGITVVVQHSDGSQSWYGKLDDIEVQLYDFIEKGAKIGKVTENENGINGTYYFAIKKGDSFIDPIQVINFE